MSYLSKLASRSVEQPQAIRPRLPSLFEPVAGPQIHWFKQIAGSSATRRPNVMTEPGEQRAIAKETKPSPVDPSDKSVMPDERTVKKSTNDRARIEPAQEALSQGRPHRPALETPVITTRAEHRSIAAQTTKPHRDPPQPARAIQEEKVFRDRGPSAIQVAHVIETTVLEGQLHTPLPATPTVETQRVKLENPAPSVIVRPAVSAAEAQMPGNASLSVPDASQPETRPLEAPPSVRITIGRVDVRAIMTPPPAVVPTRQTPARGPLSLDEYLKQRNGD